MTNQGQREKYEIDSEKKWKERNTGFSPDVIMLGTDQPKLLGVGFPQ